jgi:nitrate reductase molybdenum cofactor assembly chaperone NarJ/NarW
MTMLTFNTPQPIGRPLRVFAALLSYPTRVMHDDLPEMREIMRNERVVAVSRRAELDAFMIALEQKDAFDVEADYVELFDRGRATSLHLFEHVHGDSRDRGPAMIDLGQTYAKSGLLLAEGELPDYLPAVLEFVSTQPPAEARAFLGEMVHIFNAIFSSLIQRRSPYASVLGALIELAGEKAQPIEPTPDESIDEVWAEPVVFDGCSSKGQAKPGQAQPIHIVRSSKAARINNDHTPGAAA